MCVGDIFFTVLPWPFAAVAAAHAGAAGRGSSQRLGPLGASGSHNTLCRGPPYTCGESAGTLPYPAGRGGEKDGLVRTRAKGEERREYCKKSVSEKNSIEKTMIKVQGVVVFVLSDLCVRYLPLCANLSTFWCQYVCTVQFIVVYVSTLVFSGHFYKDVLPNLSFSFFIDISQFLCVNK